MDVPAVDPSSQRFAGWRAALVVALGLAGLWMAFYPMFTSGFAHMQQDPHDTRHLNFVLENGYRWMKGESQLFSPDMFWPMKGVATYTETLIGLVPFYVPFRLLGLAPDSAMQAWMVFVAVLNYLASLLLLRRGFGFGWLGTAFGAFLISFGCPRLTQIGHQHLLPHFFTVLAVYALARLFSGAPHPRRQVALLFGSVVAQLYAGIYFGWFLCFLLGVAFVLALALPKARPHLLGLLRAQWPVLLAAAVISGLLLVPLGLPYVKAAHTVGYRSFAEVSSMLPRIQSWFYQGDRSVLYGGLASTALYGHMPMWWEHSIGIGFVTLPVAVYGLWQARARPAFQVIGATVLATIVLTMWYRGHWSPWWLVFKLVPGGGALRAVSRIGILVLIPWGIGLGAFFDRPLTTLRARVLAGVFGVFAVAEQPQVQPSYDKAAQREEVAQLVAKIPAECTAFYYSPRSTGPFERLQLDAMWAGLLTHKHCVNGYSSNWPPDYENLRYLHWMDEPSRELHVKAVRDWEKLHGLPEGTICVVH